MKIKMPKSARKFLTANDIKKTTKVMTEAVSEAVETLSTKYGEKYVLHTSKGDVLLNNTSLKNLIKRFGKDSENWKGKRVTLKVVSVLISGTEKKALIVS